MFTWSFQLMQKSHVIKCKTFSWLKTLKKTRNRSKQPQRNKGHIWKTISNFSSEIRNETRMPTFATSIQFSTRSYSQNNYVRWRYKKHPKGKEEVKISLFADNMISYIESAKDSTHTHIHTHTQNPKVMDGMFSVPSHQFCETSESKPMVSELYS